MWSSLLLVERAGREERRYQTLLLSPHIGAFCRGNGLEMRWGLYVMTWLKGIVRVFFLYWLDNCLVGKVGAPRVA